MKTKVLIANIFLICFFSLNSLAQTESHDIKLGENFQKDYTKDNFTNFSFHEISREFIPCDKYSLGTDPVLTVTPQVESTPEVKTLTVSCTSTSSSRKGTWVLKMAECFCNEEKEGDSDERYKNNVQTVYINVGSDCRKKGCDCESGYCDDDTTETDTDGEDNEGGAGVNQSMGKSASPIKLNVKTPSADSFRPRSLKHTENSADEDGIYIEVTDESNPSIKHNSLRQVKAKERFADIETIDANSYSITLYDSSTVTTKNAQNLYVITDQEPLKKVTISNPDLGSPYNRMRVKTEDFRHQSVKYEEFVYDAATKSWSLKKGFNPDDNSYEVMETVSINTDSQTVQTIEQTINSPVSDGNSRPVISQSFRVDKLIDYNTESIGDKVYLKSITFKTPASGFSDISDVRIRVWNGTYFYGHVIGNSTNAHNVTAGGVSYTWNFDNIEIEKGQDCTLTFHQTGAANTNVQIPVFLTKASPFNYALSDTYLGVQGVQHDWSHGVEFSLKVDIEAKGGSITKTKTLENGLGVVALRTAETWGFTQDGKKLLSSTADPGGLNLETSHTYTNGNLTRTDFPDGSWETTTYSATNRPLIITRSSGLFTEYKYDANDRISKMIESFNSSNYSTNENNHKVTIYTYAPVFSGDDGSEQPYRPRTVTVKMLGQPVSKTYYGYLANEEHIIQASSPTAGINNANNLISSTYTNTDGDVVKTVNPDGSGSITTYETTGTTKTTTTASGVFNAGFDEIVQGTETVETETDDLLLLTETYDIASGHLISSRAVTERDSSNREKRVDYHDGTYEMSIYGCCTLDSTRSREGIWTDYTYDSLGRQVTSTTNGVVTIITYDAAGNILKREQQGTDSTLRTLSESQFDLAGRLQWSKDGLGNQTSFFVTYNEGETTTTTTYPNNTTEITVTDSEGRLVSLSGTAVFPKSADIDEERVVLDSDLGYHVHVQRSGETDNWVDSYTDTLGRIYKSVDIDGATSKQFYASGTGELIKSESPSGAVNIYYYEPANNLQIEALDVNQNGVIDYGIDTITRTQSDWYENTSNIIYQRTKTWINPDSLANPGSADNINEVSNDGLARINTSITNGISSTFEMHTEVTDDGILTSTATRPDGSYSEIKFINGLQEYEKSYDSNDNLLHQISFSYDEYQRLKTQNDSRNGVTSYTYDLTNKVLTLTTADPDGSGPQTAQVFENSYNNMGLRDWVKNPDGTQINFEYTSQGLIKKSYGANVYPREYIYDNEGQLQKIKTWKNYSAQTGGNDITWAYNAKGQMVTETDKFGRVTTYTYYPESGLLHTKVSPRGITKTYSYDSSGRLETIDYSDDTPTIGFTYNTLGQIDTITDEAGTRTFKYNDLGQFTGTDWNSGPFHGVETTYSYDAIGRQGSFERTINGIQQTVSYEYDNFGRLSKVIKGDYSFEYSYLNNSPKTVDKMTVKKGTAAQMHSIREFDKIMRTTKFSWITGGGQ